MRRGKKTYLGLIRGLLLPCVIAAVLLFFATALESLESGSSEESRHQLEAVLRRSCATCYAAEGSYPPDLMVEVRLEGKKYVILRWQAVSGREESGAGGLNLWDGLPTF